MPTLGAPLDFTKYEARNIRAHQLGAAPSSPVTGQLYYNTGDNTLYWWDGTVWQSGKGGAPSGAAGGVLSGTYPNPGFANPTIFPGTAQIPVVQTTSLGIGATASAPDIFLVRDAANLLAIRNGTTQQALYLYNTYTSAANYERLEIQASANTFYIRATFAAPGVSRALAIGTYGANYLQFMTNGLNRWFVDPNGLFIAAANNTLDIGDAAAAGKPRTVYAATSVVAPQVQADTFALGQTTPDVFMVREAANILGHRNATNPQSVYVYNTYTSPTVYERLELTWTSNTAYVQTAQQGATLRQLILRGNAITLIGGGAANWSVDINGMFSPTIDNTLDIGVSGTPLRVRNIYVASSVRVGVGSTGTLQLGAATVAHDASFPGKFVFSDPIATGFLEQTTITTPANAPAGSLRLYPKADGKFYSLDSAGVETQIGSGASGPPTGAAGGDLSGTYPNPQIATGVIVDTDVAAANKDGAVGVASMRTLGAGAQQAMAGNTRLDQVTIPTASVNVNNQKIINLATPTAGTDAATKAYVDAFDQGLDVKISCRVASTTTLSLAGPGATVDGVSMVAGDRMLLKDQATPSQNGIYIWNGAAVAATRATDADTSAEVTAGMFTFIEDGAVNADSGWVLTTNNPITLDTTALAFAQFSGAGQVIAGNGLTKVGNQLDVGGTTNRITVGADTVDIAATYVGQTSITTLGTIATGVWNGTAVPVANGGTGQATAKAARESGLIDAGYYTSATHGAGATISVTAATHGLRASRGLVVQVQDEASGAIEMPDVVVAANGDVTVTYGVSLTANTKRVTVLG